MSMMSRNLVIEQCRSCKQSGLVDLNDTQHWWTQEAACVTARRVLNQRQYLVSGRNLYSAHPITKWISRALVCVKWVLLAEKNTPSFWDPGCAGRGAKEMERKTSRKSTRPLPAAGNFRPFYPGMGRLPWKRFPWRRRWFPGAFVAGREGNFLVFGRGGAALRAACTFSSRETRDVDPIPA